ncbi:putative spermidine/putrescine transport system ATP-binding protein [Nonomuraea solani]|uniref:ABC-type quaternary amine transporter n=1 Tax=Nonomuraea solani TaxID=1144553 RepID=A0A1H6ETV1_9ACTN|nr:ABC transporter ATP-binding protein [Nonomuraea solani]SEH01278.1 putative spermidine/putrescine transport system ATP-binding protein [Nonomuraea solani]
MTSTTETPVETAVRRGRLRLDGVRKVLGGKEVVSAVDLETEPGEFLTLLGPSGCGKTTTLNMVAGHLTADGGLIEVDGRDITAIPPHRRSMGMVFQSYALFPHMTIADNVAFGLRMRKVAASRRKKRVAEVLEMVGLDGMSERHPRQLSGGQQQRAALARALVIEPDLLLLDEPFSNLDAQLRVRLRDEVASLQRRIGTTTILVTHDQEEALAVSDRIAVMADGVIHQLDRPQEIYLRPATDFVAQFIGEVNALDGTAAGPVAGGYACTVAGATVAATPAGEPPAEGAAVRLYVRPEVVRIRTGGDGLPGTVRDTRFLGSRIRCVVATEAGTVTAALPFDAQVPATGEEVTCSWRPSDASLATR